MLNIELLKDALNSGKQVIRDVEVEFLSISLVPDNVTKSIINLVEKAQYNGGTTFIDRHGITLYTSELSTGCKACLCAYYNPDKYISFEEAGDNAIGAAISLLKDANICIWKFEDKFYDYGIDNEFMIKSLNKHFSSIAEYNEWEGDL